jgi:hypothetical protein
LDISVGSIVNPLKNALSSREHCIEYAGQKQRQKEITGGSTGSPPAWVGPAHETWEGESMDKDFDPKALIGLDECVINALQLFTDPQTEFPKPDLTSLKRPLVVGSGNAIATGRIIFDSKDAVFADESTYQGKLDAVEDIDGVVLLSASGGKHAPVIARDVKARGRRIMLFTCNPEPLAKHDVDEVHVFPSRPEPYTYNTSTYMAMMMACLLDDPRAEAQRILEYIGTAVDAALNDFGERLGNYGAFFLLVPEQFDLIRVMLMTKFVELFGRRLARDVFTWEQAKHATTVIETPNELFLAFGRENTIWGTERLNIPLPEHATYPAMMAVGYYVIGKIQAQKPDWFKQSIVPFTQKASEIFGQKLPPIVKFR